MKKSNNVVQRRPNHRDVEVGERIRASRLDVRLSQTELAAKLGVTFQQVQKYEKGVNRVSAGRLEALAAALGVSIAYIVTGSNKAVGRDETIITQLCQTRGGTELARSYNSIKSAEKRQALLTMARQLAA